MKVIGTLDLLPKVLVNFNATDQLVLYSKAELQRDGVFWWGLFYLELTTSSVEELSWQLLAQHSLVLTVVDNLSDCGFLVRFTSQASCSFLDRNQPTVICKGHQPCLTSEAERRIFKGNKTQWYHLVLEGHDRVFLANLLCDVSANSLISKCFVVFDLFAREILSYEMEDRPRQGAENKDALT